jgi:hypothetical protein
LIDQDFYNLKEKYQSNKSILESPLEFCLKVRTGIMEKFDVITESFYMKNMHAPGFIHTVNVDVNIAQWALFNVKIRLKFSVWK